MEPPFFGYFDPLCVATLNWLVDATTASVVVSSTWRLMGVPRLRAKFELEGMKVPIIDRTPDIYELSASTKIVSLSRGQQIEAWLQQTSYEIEAFVILDDEDDMDKHAPRLIQTSSHIGLTTKDAQRAAAMLNLTATVHPGQS